MKKTVELCNTPKFFRGKTLLSYEQVKKIAQTFQGQAPNPLPDPPPHEENPASTPEENKVTLELEHLWIDHGGEA